MATYLQTLKEAFADPSEALKLRWIDVDFSNNVITINNSVKGHRPRQMTVSYKLIAMLNTLPKTSENANRSHQNNKLAFKISRLGDAYVLYLEVSFDQKSGSFSVLSVSAYGNSLVLGVHRDYGDGFSIWAFGYADLLHAGRL